MSLGPRYTCPDCDGNLLAKSTSASRCICGEKPTTTEGPKAMPLLSTSKPYDPAARGFYAVYRDNETTYCPGCGRTHWIIGRLLAECAFCATAIPLSADLVRNDGLPTITKRKGSGRFQ